MHQKSMLLFSSLVREKKVKAIVLDDGFLLNTVVTLQWDDGFIFLLFSDRWIFLPFLCAKGEFELGPTWSFGTIIFVWP